MKHEAVPSGMESQEANRTKCAFKPWDNQMQDKHTDTTNKQPIKLNTVNHL